MASPFPGFHKCPICYEWIPQNYSVQHWQNCCPKATELVPLEEMNPGTATPLASPSRSIRASGVEGPEVDQSDQEDEPADLDDEPEMKIDTVEGTGADEQMVPIDETASNQPDPAVRRQLKQQTLFASGLKTFSREGREYAPGPSTTEHQFTHFCRVPGCTFRGHTSQSISEHTKKDHPWVSGNTIAGYPPPEVKDQKPGSIIAQHLMEAKADVEPPVEEVIEEIMGAESDDAEVVPSVKKKVIKMTKARRGAPARPKETRGADERKSYSDGQKLKHIDIHEGALAAGFNAKDDRNRAAGTPVPWSTLNRWRKPEELKNIVKRYSQSVQDKFAKKRHNYASRWRNKTMKVFISALRKRCLVIRRAYRRLDTRTVNSEARAIHVVISSRIEEGRAGYVPWPASNRSKVPWKPSLEWCRTFMRANGFKVRQNTNRRQLDPVFEAKVMDEWNRSMRERIKELPLAGAVNEFHNHFGYFELRDRFNADQVPCQFDFQSSGKSWASPEDLETKSFKIKGAGQNLERRQFTLQICVSADPDQVQPPPCIIFRGTGNRIPVSERAQYADGVHVLWQHVAWMDRPTMAQWLDDVWIPYTNEHVDENRVVLLNADSLDASRTEDYRKKLAENRTIAHLGPPKSTTHIWQMIDRGVGKHMKWLIREEQNTFLLSKRNRNTFYHSSAGERRILLTHWYKAAHDRFMSEYKSSLGKMALRSGLAIGLTQEGVEHVSVESCKRGTPFKVKPYDPHALPLEGYTPLHWRLSEEEIEEDDEGVAEEADDDTSSSDGSETADDSEDQVELEPVAVAGDNGGAADEESDCPPTEIASVASSCEEDIIQPAIEGPKHTFADLKGLLMTAKKKNADSLYKAVRFLVKQGQLGKYVKNKTIDLDILRDVIKDYAKMEPSEFGL